MADKHKTKRYYAGSTYRVISAAFGLFLVVVGSTWSFSALLTHSSASPQA